MADFYVERYYSNDFNSEIRYKDLTLRIHDYVLTLHVKIFFKQMHPPNGQTTFTARDADGNTATAQAWGYTEFYDYCAEFKRQCYEAWNNVFVLVPPPHYNVFVDPATGVRRNIRCQLQIDLVDHEGPGIHTIEAYRLVDVWNSLRANAGLLSSNDSLTLQKSLTEFQPIDFKKDRNGKMCVTGGNPQGLTYYWNYQVFPHGSGTCSGWATSPMTGQSVRKLGPTHVVVTESTCRMRSTSWAEAVCSTAATLSPGRNES
jgi:hypothetical protein